jgi:hypothetical protein
MRMRRESWRSISSTGATDSGAFVRGNPSRHCYSKAQGLRYAKWMQLTCLCDSMPLWMRRFGGLEDGLQYQPLMLALPLPS